MRIIQLSEGTKQQYTCKRYPDITFVEGMTRENEKGKYVILSINPSSAKMNVQYVDGKYNGTTQLLDMEGQGVTIHRKNRDTLRNQGITPSLGNTSATIFSVGFLATNAKLHIQTTSKEHDAVIRRYQALTGENPSSNPDFEVVPDGPTKWFTQLRLFLPTNIPPEVLEHLTFGANVRLNARTSGNYELNKTPLIWHLIAIGFRLGKEHDIEKIQSHMCQTPDDMEQFQAGMNAGKQTSSAL